MLKLPERLTIESVGQLRDTLLAAIEEAAGALSLDARQVHEIDGAGLQLLLSTASEAAERTVHLELRPSAPLADTLRLLGLSDRFTLCQEPTA